MCASKGKERNGAAREGGKQIFWLETIMWLMAIIINECFIINRQKKN